MTVVNDRLSEPGANGGKLFAGGLITHGTRMPPCDGKHLNSLEGAVDACAHSGPSLYILASYCLVVISVDVPGIRVVGTDVVVGVVAVLVNGGLDVGP